MGEIVHMSTRSCRHYTAEKCKCRHVTEGTRYSSPAFPASAGKLPGESEGGAPPRPAPPAAAVPSAARRQLPAAVAPARGARGRAGRKRKAARVGLQDGGGAAVAAEAAERRQRGPEPGRGVALSPSGSHEKRRVKGPAVPLSGPAAPLPPPALAPSPPGGGAGPGLGQGPARRPAAGAAPCRTPVGGWRSTPSTRIGNGTTGAPGTSPPPMWSGWRGCRCWCAPSRTVRAWPGLRGGLGRPPPGPGPPPLAPRGTGPRRAARPAPAPLAAPLAGADTRRRRAWLLVPSLPAFIREDPRGLLFFSPFF